MEFPNLPRGLIVDLITPLRNDGAIDGRGLGRLLDRVSPYAQALLLASPQIGEGKNLSSRHRSELLEKTLVVVRQRPIPIFMWSSRDTEEATRQTLFEMREVLKKRNYGSTVYWVDSPLYYHSNRGLPAYYHDICSDVLEPFILHNDPEFIKDISRPFKRSNIRTAILKELLAIENITGLIFSGSLDRAGNYQKACHGRKDFRIYDGDEAAFLEHPSMSGVASVGANLAPKAWQEVTQSSIMTTGDRKNYPDYLQQLWEVGIYLRNLKDIYGTMPVVIIKEVLSDMGIIETPTCTEGSQDVEESKRRIKELMTHYGDYPGN